MGLWHGANWTFVFWGIYHAIMIFTERQLKPIRERIPFFNTYLVGWMVTLPLVMLSWIPFRAKNMNDTIIMFGKIFNPVKYTFYTMRENNYIITALILVLILLNFGVNNYLEKRISQIPLLSFGINCLKFTIIIIFVFTFLRPISQFIYFQF